MNTHVDCIACVINKANKLADKYFEDKHKKYNFMNQVLREVSKIEYDRTAPFLVAKVMRILKKETGINDFYLQEKKLFNKKLLSMENQIEDMLNHSKDRFITALKIALAGNIVDFGAFDEISFDLVKDIINKTLASDFDDKLYRKLKNDLLKCKTLLYLGDNTGEIVFDKIFIREIIREYPDIEIFFAVRGEPVLNDVNEEDAYYVELNKYANIISNGTDLPGTDLLEVCDEFKEIFKKSDIIISKGQGNFESLPGCKQNVYYLFLCKCDLLVKKLKTEKLANMFIHESKL
ncbi:damage-control phosphatase ARMT1 family protein [Tepidibacter hydrothermalis]|uniref:ARMT1-like domain-containing protein n=1 Tax=Tepidibacter hydrothermalis TaxID=3036126 RepID=A0ABY8E7W1_9FIRM|nr:ARMT1-like domain-containing protein [Tepidibacter hydrothermalis]WFD08926.1 ARMT1-like domain-containing protein [Tepidibacter hydrothermalis]